MSFEIHSKKILKSNQVIQIGLVKIMIFQDKKKKMKKI